MDAFLSQSQRVTLKIEVPYTEHSHVIGKGGQNIRKVMEKTNCHIHFPDSNRGNTQDKSNQVTVHALAIDRLSFSSLLLINNGKQCDRYACSSICPI